MECNIRQVFRLIDQDGNGVISAEEIKRVLRQNGVACGRTGLGLMNMGTLCSDSISFREFAAAVVEVSHAAGCICLLSIYKSVQIDSCPACRCSIVVGPYFVAW